MHMVIKLQAGYFISKQCTMQNNCVLCAVISKMLLLQHDVHSYYIYNQRWPDRKFVV